MNDVQTHKTAPRYSKRHHIQDGMRNHIPATMHDKKSDRDFHDIHKVKVIELPTLLSFHSKTHPLYIWPCVCHQSTVLGYSPYAKQIFGNRTHIHTAQKNNIKNHHTLMLMNKRVYKTRTYMKDATTPTMRGFAQKALRADTTET